jgi:diguanylate cyclase (GGDEF)-like protein/PAS domain S-box-containing protein
VRDAEPEAPTGDRRAAADGGPGADPDVPGTVLVVDDDPAVLALITSVLERAGFDVLGATDADAALERVRGRRIDLALLDVLMPGTDGIELCALLRDELGDDMVPVVFLSALQDADSKQRGFEAGGVDYLAKPFRREELVARTRAHVALLQERRRLAAGQAELTARAETAIAAARTSSEQLASVEAQLAQLFDTFPDPVYMKDADGVYLTCNRAVSELLSRPSAEVIGATDLDLFDEVDARRFRASDVEALQADGPVVTEELVRAADGRRLRYATTRVGVHRPDGSLVGVLGIANDLTERHAHDQALQSERDRLNDALDAAKAATWELDTADGAMLVGDRYLALLGEEPQVDARFPRAVWEERIHPEDRAQVLAMLEQLQRGATARHELEYRLRHRDGHDVWVRGVGRAFTTPGRDTPRAVGGMVLDITSERAHREQLDFAAQHDGLTGLSNRPSFADHLREELEACHARDGRLAVVTFDLDGFEAINDLHGRAGGNQLLVEVAMRLVQHLGDRSLVGRVGGDEFSVILRDLPQGRAWEDCVEELHTVVSRPVQQQGRMIHATASIGVTLIPQARKVDAEQLLRQADQAVYQAKLAGKDRYHVFDPADDAETRERYLLFGEIERALANDELVLHYQPQVDMRTGEVFGLEALIRWQHPVRGLLPPGTFIPQLAGHALSIEVGDWVIEAALAQLERWAADGWDILVSVNVDAAQLYDPDFVERLQRQLAAAPTVRPDQLGVEILETGALVDLGHVSGLLGDLHALGVRSSLDDFGTGFSSLTLLKQLPADVIKIDRSFVMQVLEDPQHAVIIDSIVALCRSFQRTVLAEGVETEEHGQVLLELGCDRAQGFGIARPMPADAVAGWVAGWSPPATWTAATVVPEDRVPGLIADLEHRSWLHRLDTYLDGDTRQLPPMEPTACRLGRWLRRERTSADRAQLRDVTRLHQALHEEAADLVARQLDGTDRLEGARAALDRRSEAAT